MLYREIIAVFLRSTQNTQIHCVGRTYSLCNVIIHAVATKLYKVNNCTLSHSIACNTQFNRHCERNLKAVTNSTFCLLMPNIRACGSHVGFMVYNTFWYPALNSQHTKPSHIYALPKKQRRPQTTSATVVPLISENKLRSHIELESKFYHRVFGTEREHSLQVFLNIDPPCILILLMFPRLWVWGFTSSGVLGCVTSRLEGRHCNAEYFPKYGGRMRCYTPE